MSYHVRRAGLPRPGTDRQLQDFVARVQPRELDRTRPLWEVYLVEGLQDGRFAIVTKTHHALIDGVNALDIAHVIVDAVKGEDLDDAVATVGAAADRRRPVELRRRGASSTRCAARPRSSTSCAAASTRPSASASRRPSRPAGARLDRRPHGRPAGAATRPSTPRSGRRGGGS